MGGQDLGIDDRCPLCGGHSDGEAATSYEQANEGVIVGSASDQGPPVSPARRGVLFCMLGYACISRVARICD